MMALREEIRDPTLAAYYVAFGGWKLEVVERAKWRSTWWGRVIDAFVPDPREIITDGMRVGLTLYATPDFARRIELYMNSFPLEARERRAALQEEPRRKPTEGEHG